MKKTLKKLGMILSLTACVGMLAGCGGNKQEQQAADNGADKVYKIGINQFADHPSLDNCRLGLIDGLKEAGYEEGVNVEFLYDNGMADTGITNQIAQNYVANKCDLICGIATPAAQASYNAAEGKVPVIYTAVSDPVAAGLADEQGLGKATTGTSDVLPLEKQVEMIRAFLPEAKTIGVLYSTSEANSVAHIARLEEIVDDYGFTLVTVGVTNASEIPMAADNILGKVDCLNNLTDNTIVSSLSVILDKANAKGIPVFGSEIEQVKNGCAAAESIDYYQLGVQTGKMAARVLDGEDINTMPFEAIKDSATVINSKVLEVMGITLDENMTVTDVIE